MPVHDWTRVDAGIFHDFHLAWIAELRKTLNAGTLPTGYYALAEQMAGSVGPDVLTLQARDVVQDPGEAGKNGRGGTAVAPPKVRFTAKLGGDSYVKKARRLTIRHSSDDRVVAILESVSPGNKRTRAALRTFVDKAYAIVREGFHLLLVDVFPPGPGDPQGIHAALWNDLGGDAFTPPVDKPLTLAAYAAGDPITAYVEPLAVGDALAEMPLFLEPDWYVNVPLEATYQAAWEGVPERWRRVLEAETN
jgi:hypothetical protein